MRLKTINEALSKKAIGAIQKEFGDLGVTYGEAPIETTIKKVKEFLDRPDSKIPAHKERRQNYEKMLKGLEEIKKQGYKSLVEYAESK